MGENNVDLNRNALTPEGLAEVLARDPNIAGYEDFQSLFLATTAPSRFFAHIGFWFQALYLVARYGARHLKRAMVTATYHHSNGIFFGGRKLQQSHVLLNRFLHHNFGHVPAEEVAWLDVHTGLGPKGVDVLLCTSDDKNAIIQGFPGVDVQCSSDVKNADKSQAAGYELTRGFLKGGKGAFYQRPFDSTKGQALIATQEFGTVPGIMVARAMVLENKSFVCDFSNHEYWRQFTRDAFYVREPMWKASVMSRGQKVFAQLSELIHARASL